MNISAKKQPAYYGCIILLILLLLNSCSQLAYLNLMDNNVKLQVARLISHVTMGIISKDQDIKVRFTRPLVGEEQVGKILNNHYLSFNPPVNGVLKWEDANTLSFSPDKELALRKAYTATLKLNSLPGFAENREFGNIKFNFNTRGQEIKKIEGDFRYLEEKGKVIFKGVISFIEKAKLKAVENSINFLINKKNLKLSFSPVKDNTTFGFQSEPFQQTNSVLPCSLKIASRLLDLSNSTVKEYLLPAANQFKVNGFTAVDEGDKPMLVLKFSRDLDLAQDIKGLLQITPYLDTKINVIANNVYLHGNFTRGERYRITVNPNIRSADSNKVNQEVEMAAEVPDMKPQLSFVSDGVFLPSVNKQKIRFKTVNLRQVYLNIKRVFDNNTCQFLQTEKLTSIKDRHDAFDDWYLNRVGVDAAGMELRIGDVKNRWLQHEIDLSKLVNSREKGFLIISLTFRREDMLYNFNTTGRYDDYYADPNSYGYVYAHGAIYKPVIFTDIGLTCKSTGKEHYIFATNINDAAPLSDVNITLHTYQNQVIASAKTDKNGIAKFENIGQDVFFVQGQKDEQKTVVKPSEMAWNLTTFDVGGEEPVSTEGTRAFLYTERGVYRPGDEVNLSCILRNKDETFPANHPVTFKLSNPRNQVVLTTVNKEGVDGLYSFNFKTREEDPTGNWQAEITAGSRSFNTTIKIETIVPFRLKVKLEPAKAELSARDTNLDLKLTSTYLFGNPASGLQAEVEAIYKNEAKRFSQYPGFFFSNEAINFNAIYETVFTDYLDQDGRADISRELPYLQGAPSGIAAEINARVYEKGGRASQNSITVPINPYRYYVGIERQQNEYGYFEIGSALKLKTLLVDTDGKPQAGKKLAYKLYRNSTYWWWEFDSQDEFRYSYKSDSNTEVVQEGTVVSGAAPVSISVKPETWGEYFLEVTDTSNTPGHTAGYFFWASRWGENPREAGTLTLKTDKERYAPGDTAEITFERPETGNVLVSIEKPAKLINTQWYNLTGNKKTTTIKLPVTADMLPTVYVSVSIIQPHIQTANDRPIRMFGVIPVNVVDFATHLELEIKTVAALRPGETFDVEIQTKDKKQAQFTIAIVDEGLLDITRFLTPDPWNKFYRKQKLNILTSDVFSSVIGAHKGDIFKVFSVGGDYNQGMFEGEGTKEKRRFDPVSLFKGPVQTNKAGYSKLSFTMPNYIGSVKIMVIAADKNRYGNTEKQVPVKSDLALLPTLPRVLGPDETFKIPVTVFAMTQGITNVDVTLSVSGPLRIAENSRKNIRFNTIGDQDLFYTVITKPEVGTGTILLTAVSGKYQSTSETYIPVRATSPRIYAAEEKTIERGTEAVFTIPDRGLPGTNHAQLEIRKFPDLVLNHRLNWLIHYPYGCIEQTTSSVFPQLYLKEITKLTADEEKAIDNNINAGITRLGKFMTPSGGFGYWPGDSTPSAWGTNYAGHFLIEAKVRGYYVPPELLANWKKYQAAMALTAEETILTRVYRLYLLALYGEAAVGPMNLIKENNLPRLSNTEKWLLAAAYKMAGVDATAKQIMNTAGTAVKAYNELGGTYGSDLRDKGMILDCVVYFKDWKTADNLFKEIARSIAADTWYSTQTVAYSLLAIGRYLVENKPDTSEMKGIITLPGGNKEFFTTDKFKYTYTFDRFFGQQIKVSLDKNAGPKRIYAILEWDGIPLKPETKELTKNLDLTVSWYDEDGNYLDPVALAQGQTFWAHFKAKRLPGNSINLEELALVQLIPSGWEIENTRLSGEDFPAWGRELRLNRAQYTDIRDDRIMWFFDMPSWDKEYDFLVKLNAITAGEFYMPPALFEAMYNTQDYQAIRNFYSSKISVAERGTVIRSKGK